MGGGEPIEGQATMTPEVMSELSDKQIKEHMVTNLMDAINCIKQLRERHGQDDDGDAELGYLFGLMHQMMAAGRETMIAEIRHRG